jgi:4-phytase/acid phosphatase
MKRFSPCRSAFGVGLILLSLNIPLDAQLAAKADTESRRKHDSFLDRGHNGETLRFVVVLSRHGVRSPTATPAQYNIYSVAPWPEWDVPPGNLTTHGFELMREFGAYDREALAAKGLSLPRECSQPSGVTIYADSDQRTRETGRALADGLFPGCNAAVIARPEGINDPLFHPDATALTASDRAIAVAAIAGRIGGDPANLTVAYRVQIQALDHLLASCGVSTATQQKRTSLFDLPASLATGRDDHAAELRGPLNTASTLAENLLLEYAQGMSAANVGWGRVTGADLNSIMELHSAAVDFTQRTPAVARLQSANLLNQIVRSLDQAASDKAVEDAIGKPSDRALFLVGHDTNIENIAGLLNLTWIIDGRRDDTPPGSALIFELWKNQKTSESRVRTYFTAQTLHQMRTASALTSTNPPQTVPIFLPGCSGADQSCSLPEFQRSLEEALNSGSAKSRK